MENDLTNVNFFSVVNFPNSSANTGFAINYVFKTCKTTLCTLSTLPKRAFLGFVLIRLVDVDK